MSNANPTSKPQRILISGGSGFIGRALLEQLHAAGHQLTVLSRNPDVHQALPADVRPYHWLSPAFSADAVINLAGAGIADRRWSASRKQQLLDSRLQPTTTLCRWANETPTPPASFISASAIGYYGAQGEQTLDENSAAGEDFGAQLCQRWEAALQLPSTTRVVVLRLGVVLDRDGGALARMLPAFRLGLGGRIGDGRQWMSLIARADVLRLIEQALVDERLHGAINAVMPQPIRNRDFTAALAQCLQRPALLPVPALALRLALGDMSSLLLESQRVVPRRLTALDFAFQYPDAASALQRALNASGPSDCPSDCQSD